MQKNKQFAKGDTVRIKQWLSPTLLPPEPSNEMRSLAGKTTTVKGRSSLGLYLLDIDGGKHWWWGFWLEPAANWEITITQDGRTTKATYLEDGKPLAVSYARCSPEDCFSVKAGAVLALSRLAENAGKVRLYHTALSCSCGVCGTPTNYKDAFGTPLAVGDVVRACTRHGETRSNTIVEVNGKAYIDGLFPYCNPATGEVRQNVIIKEKSYTDIEPGTLLRRVLYKTTMI
ncbi:MAG: hypothetical protein EGR97_09970 [Clostridiales bacterium]|nr:hypothetical protein [Clostridiales bacterium]